MPTYRNVENISVFGNETGVVQNVQYFGQTTDRSTLKIKTGLLWFVRPWSVAQEEPAVILPLQ
jgi:hypothetical protein